MSGGGGGPGVFAESGQYTGLSGQRAVSTAGLSRLASRQSAQSAHCGSTHGLSLHWPHSTQAHKPGALTHYKRLRITRNLVVI